MMRNLFIPYKLAVIAKEKGFKDDCLKSISETGFENDYSILGAKNWNEMKGIVSIPIYQQVVDWFREKHSITIEINLYSRKFDVSNDFANMIFKITVIHPTKGDCVPRGRFQNYYEALNKAIEEAFKLI